MLTEKLNLEKEIQNIAFKIKAHGFAYEVCLGKEHSGVIKDIAEKNGLRADKSFFGYWKFSLL